MVTSVVVIVVLEFIFILAMASMCNFLSPRNDLINDGISGLLSGREESMVLSESLRGVADPRVEGFHRDNLSLWPKISICPFP